MRLNSLKPAAGAKTAAKRVGRGPGSGLGKTAGRGHKGQKSRTGGFHKIGFEGGQMPLQRRVPKQGFRSPTAQDKAQVRLSALAKLDADVTEVDLLALKKAHLVPERARRVKIIASGRIERALVIKGVGVTKGARASIEAAGGTVEL